MLAEISRPLLITSRLLAGLPFWLRSCRLCLHREPTGPVGSHGNHTRELPSGGALKLTSSGQNRRETLSHSVSWRRGEGQGRWASLISRNGCICGVLVSVEPLLAGSWGGQAPAQRKAQSLAWVSKHWDVLSRHEPGSQKHGSRGAPAGQGTSGSPACPEGEPA